MIEFKELDIASCRCCFGRILFNLKRIRKTIQLNRIDSMFKCTKLHTSSTCYCRCDQLDFHFQYRPLVQFVFWIILTKNKKKLVNCLSLSPFAFAVCVEQCLIIIIIIYRSIWRDTEMLWIFSESDFHWLYDTKAENN